MSDPSRNPLIDVEASLAVFEKGEHIQRHRGIKVMKLRDDLDRYEWIIATTKPEVIVETGSRHGGSALWFADQGVDFVISADLQASEYRPADPRIMWITGDSIAPSTVDAVRNLIPDGARVMVVLDSEHAAPHVRAEIRMYGPMVTSGQYLVVEDTIFAYSTTEQLSELTLQSLIDYGTPMDAVEKLLVNNEEWIRDTAIEEMLPTSHFPAGWWRRA